MIDHGFCRAIASPDDDGRFLARGDVRTAFVRGDDLLAVVNRSPVGGLPADWAPDDLVDLATMRPSTAAQCEPPGGQCLRAEAARALVELMGAMRREGFEGHVHSAFRAYGSQCAVFEKWAHREGQGFCRATEQSALAGHSQHQLGTTLDLFTREWAHGGPVFRPGFGCSPGGRWLAEHAWEHGFVLPYPTHPDRRGATACIERDDAPRTVDPRTGYRYEPWHLRYIGVENAARFHAEWQASGPGTGGEITLEQWLRRRASRAAEAELPVCDGCACGACATLARSASDSSSAPCEGRALRVGDDGAPVGSSAQPALLEARAARDGERVVLRVRVDVPADLVTQSPSPDAALRYDAEGATFASVLVSPGGVRHRFDDLPHAWRLAVGYGDGARAGEDAWPVRVGLASPDAAETWNGADVYLPGQAGARWIELAVRPPPSTRVARLAMIRDGVTTGAVAIELP